MLPRANNKVYTNHNKSTNCAASHRKVARQLNCMQRFGLLQLAQKFEKFKDFLLQ